MKKVLPISVFLLGVFLVINVSADVSQYDLLNKRRAGLRNSGNKLRLVESEELSIADVVRFVSLKVGAMKTKTRPETRLLGISGIFQEGNTAEIYFWYVYTKNISGKEKAEGASVKIVRLNSGVWFDPTENQFILRKSDLKNW